VRGDSHLGGVPFGVCKTVALTMGTGGRRKTILGSRSAGSLDSADTLPATPVAAPQETGAPDTVATPNGGTDVEYVEEEEDGFRYKRRKREPGVCHARRREQPAWRWARGQRGGCLGFWRVRRVTHAAARSAVRVDEGCPVCYPSPR
jgi:hypothetical protein